MTPAPSHDDLSADLPSHDAPPAAPRIVDELAPDGVLRAAINLGNPVLAHGSTDDPGGVTVDLARELAARLGVPVELLPVPAAKDSFALVAGGGADLAFLAVDPTRAEQVAFSTPYLVIEGVYAVPLASELGAADEVDRPGVRIGVKEGSAYDLHLGRALQHAHLVRAPDHGTAFAEEGLEVDAGIRQAVVARVDQGEALRVLEPAFMQIRQAVGLPRGTSEEALTWLDGTLAGLVGSGFVADALARAGQDPTLAATGQEA